MTVPILFSSPRRIILDPTAHIISNPFQIVPNNFSLWPLLKPLTLWPLAQCPVLASSQGSLVPYRLLSSLSKCVPSMHNVPAAPPVLTMAH